MNTLIVVVCLLLLLLLLLLLIDLQFDLSCGRPMKRNNCLPIFWYPKLQFEIRPFQRTKLSTTITAFGQVIQFNFSTHGHLGERRKLVVVERGKQKSTYGLSAKKNGRCREVAVC